MGEPSSGQIGRRPRIATADLLIAVAAVALGTAVWRTTFASSGGGYLRHVPSPRSHSPHPLGDLGYAVHSGFFFALVNGVPQVLVASLGVVALSLRRRKDPAHPLSRRPGFVLCAGAVAASAWAVPMHGTTFWLPHRFDYGVELWRLVVEGILPNAGLMIIGLWIGLALGGRAWPVGSWLDRVGYGLAVSLVVLLALDTIRMVLEAVRLI